MAHLPGARALLLPATSHQVFEALCVLVLAFLGWMGTLRTGATSALSSLCLVSGRAWRGSRCEAKLSDCSPCAQGQKGSLPVGE